MAKQNPFTLEDLKSKGFAQNEDGSWSQPPIKSSYIKHLKLEEIKENKEKFNIISSENLVMTFIKSRVELKPISVNTAWQGKRFKTETYKNYEKAALSMLPNFKVPSPPYRLSLIFGFSNKLSDIDNPAKLVMDILQKKYGFNDKEVYELLIKKVIVPKRKEYFDFELRSI